MKVVLIQNVPKIGSAGEICEVKEGFAKNFLFPKNLAAMADDPRAEKVRLGLEKKKKEKDQMSDFVNQKITEIHSQLIEISAKTNEKGQLFASIKESEIKKIIQDRFNITPNSVNGMPIKSLGKRQVTLNFSGGKRVDITISILKK